MDPVKVIKKLKGKKIQLETKLNRAIDKFDKICAKSNVTKGDYSELARRLNDLQPFLAEYEGVCLELIELEAGDDDEKDYGDFEDTYYDIIGKISSFLDDRPSEPASDTKPAVMSVENDLSSLKLPTVQLPTFSGKYEDWLEFHDAFDSLIHKHPNLTNVQKFYYLLSAVKGEASQVLKSISVSADNYITAWSLLKRRFENKRLIIQSNLKGLFDLDPIKKDSHPVLQSFLNEILKIMHILKGYEQPSIDTLLIYIISGKFNTSLRKEWELNSYGGDFPTFEELVQFIENKCNILGALEVCSAHSNTHDNNVGKSRENYQSRSYVTAHVHKCPICKEPHEIMLCPKFLEFDTRERFNNVKRLRLCVNCLRANHMSNNCKVKSCCKKCHKKHNTLLHFDFEPGVRQSVRHEGGGNQQAVSVVNGRENDSTLDTQDSIGESNGPSSTVSCSSQFVKQTPSTTLLLTARVLVPINGKLIECRALLDSASQSNFITTTMCDRLGLKKTDSSLVVSGISGNIAQVRHKAQVRIKSRINNFSVSVSCLVIDEITEKLPTFSLKQEQFDIPVNIQLADPSFNVSDNVDLLLGAGTFLNLLCIGQHKLGKNMPTLQKTLLGWVIGGDVIDSYQNSTSVSCYKVTSHPSEALTKQVAKFWELEQCGSTHKEYSIDEEFVENHFKETTTRAPCGRFIVKMPFKLDPSVLGNSKQIALKRFINLENKFRKNVEFKNKYADFIQEYKTLGHLSKISEDESKNIFQYFLPHHAVVKENSLTSNLRVVFDASAKTQTGYSLNDIQYSGPAIQGDIVDILLRFRSYTYALTADVMKMYRQVLMAEEDRNLQLIFWRDNQNEPISTYRLNTVTYGTTSAPFLAVRCLKQLALDNIDLYPCTSKAIQNSFYVDDFIGGANSLHELLVLQSQLSTILASGGFVLRKWCSNNKSVIDKIQSHSSSDKSFVLIIDGNDTKTLGILWYPNCDQLSYEIRDPKKAAKEVTKRTILSITAQIFDPLGLISPITVVPKLIIQKLWQLNLTWDEAIPSSLYCQWQNFQKQLRFIEKIKIPRRVICHNPVKIELHGFCDASEQAFGACIYLRSVTTENDIHINLLCAKSRVAPLKSVSIPRLELCGALLLAQLAKRGSDSLEIHITDRYFWSDSTIALSWIKGSPSKWTTFVANRVGEIQRISESTQWHHVRTFDNPADLISRGVDAGKLIASDLWWSGPSWLSQEKSNWPKQENIMTQTSLEARIVSNVSRDNGDVSLLTRFSSFRKLQRVTAYCQRFVNNAKVSPESRNFGSLTNDELESSFLTIIRMSQETTFNNEIKNLLNGKIVYKKDKLLSLNPFVDDQGILRVGGRLVQSSYAYDKKHPIILSPSCPIARLIARDEHQRFLHCGPTQLLSSLREKFWILSGKSLTRKIVHDCITCFRNKPKLSNPMMGNLPANRVTATHPFYNTGIDYAGPVLIKSKKGRGAKLNKAYICIFICMSTKAIHLDLVNDLSTEEFLATLRRFISRRGQPGNLYSDNGTNFVGANSELMKIRKFVQDNQTALSDRNDFGSGIKWHFIPSSSPHFGGLWEAGVKSMKFHLRRVVGETKLTFTEFYTLLTQIEAVLNSRPLSPLSTDITDYDPLTPAHFLIGRKLTSPAEKELTEVADNRLSKFEHLQKMVKHFWNRWSKEYVSELQVRNKWKRHSAPLTRVGDLVVLREDARPTYQWRIGRVTELHTGNDGVVRVVSVRVSSGNVLKRAITKTAVLPLNR